MINIRETFDFYKVMVSSLLLTGNQPLGDTAKAIQSLIFKKINLAESAWLSSEMLFQSFVSFSFRKSMQLNG